MTMAIREEGRKILVAVDEGEESSYALSWCLKNIIVTQDTIILLYVKPPPVAYAALDGTGYLFSQDIIATMDKYRNDVAQTVIHKANKLCKDLQQVKVETRVDIGDPRDVICNVAEKMCVDMVVLGSHGYGLIKRAFLGSVSNHCAQNSKCPVLIVKRPKYSAATSTSSNRLIGRLPSAPPSCVALRILMEPSSSVITPDDVLQTLMNDGTIDTLRLKIINQLKANEDLKSTTIKMIEQSKVLNTPGAEKQTKRELFDALRQELETPVLEKASKSVWELILDSNGLGREINETVEKVFCRLSGREPPLFAPNGELKSEKGKEKLAEKSKGKEKEIQNKKDNVDPTPPKKRKVDETTNAKDSAEEVAK
ncbi:hypothetical protein QVD17_26829 [Tagetes erecta]|uniref:UspA domain-containing protein n=1 Tax=Tagetes erecta TaxID=13708 RepID=A0AAD8K7B6_TARER|nr:hypothetical protein QVD17_26829 [Tagetes erecta]